MIHRRIEDLGGTEKITTAEMEVHLMHYFEPRRNLVVPNVSWGFLPHEADLLVVTKSGCLYEVEIKISISDLKADAKKKHNHECDKIKKLYFAVPERLYEKALPYIPERAGILCVGEKSWRGLSCIARDVACKRDAVETSKYKITTAERAAIARLGTLRILGLKRKLLNANISGRIR